ncbi:MAG: hypothetical protein ACXABY_14940, partial [Candidatus Thorarchaeota archaeon]
MGIESTKGKDSFVGIPEYGVNEVAPVTRIPMNYLIEMQNFRLSDDGMRIEKRDGLTEIAGQATFGDKDIYGYATYYNTSSQFCQLVVTEDKIWQKVAAGAWTTIHTWSSSLTYPVKILEIQGRQIIVNDIENKMILADGTSVVQLGITAPTTIPTLTGGYDASMIEEDMAAIADWTDNDAGAGASSQTTYDSKSCMRLLNTGAAGDVASRSRYVTNSKIPSKYTLETSIYMNTLGTLANGDQFTIWISTGYGLTGVTFDVKEIYIVNAALDADGIRTGLVTKLDQWVNVKVVYDGSDPDDRILTLYINDEYQGEWKITNTLTSLEGYVDLNLYGETVATDVYIDYFNFSDGGGSELHGMYRYAVTYGRNGGNYPGESNPIKSLVGSATITGAGLD